MIKKIILIGAGGHAKSCLDVISSVQNKYKIVGLVEKNLTIRKVLGLRILGNDKDLEKIFKKYKYALIGLGQIKSYNLREDCFKNLKKIGFKLPPIISKYAYFSKKSKIGEGSIVMHGAVVNAFSSIGKNCIINTNSTIEHDVMIGDNCHIAGGAVINGGVKILSGTFIGSGAVIKQGVEVGKNCIIQANVFLKKDIKNNKIFIKDKL
tara:strand:- start:291 stop:914 length:624 start_codon:yes stop_codon:yes gene_type:complete